MLYCSSTQIKEKKYFFKCHLSLGRHCFSKACLKHTRGRMYEEQIGGAVVLRRAADDGGGKNGKDQIPYCL